MRSKINDLEQKLRVQTEKLDARIKELNDTKEKLGACEKALSDKSEGFSNLEQEHRELKEKRDRKC